MYSNENDRASESKLDEKKVKTVDEYQYEMDSRTKKSPYFVSFLNALGYGDKVVDEKEVKAIAYNQNIEPFFQSASMETAVKPMTVAPSIKTKRKYSVINFLIMIFSLVSIAFYVLYDILDVEMLALGLNIDKVPYGAIGFLSAFIKEVEGSGFKSVILYLCPIACLALTSLIFAVSLFSLKKKGTLLVNKILLPITLSMMLILAFVQIMNFKNYSIGVIAIVILTLISLCLAILSPSNKKS